MPKLETDVIQDKDGFTGGLKSLHTQVQQVVKYLKAISAGASVRDLVSTVAMRMDIQHNVSFKIDTKFQPTIVQLNARNVQWYDYNIVGTSVIVTAYFQIYRVLSAYDGYLDVGAAPFIAGDKVILTFADGREEESKIIAKNSTGFKISRELLTDIYGMRLQTTKANIIIL